MNFIIYVCILKVLIHNGEGRYVLVYFCNIFFKNYSTHMNEIVFYKYLYVVFQISFMNFKLIILCIIIRISYVYAMCILFIYYVSTLYIYA